MAVLTPLQLIIKKVQKVLILDFLQKSILNHPIKRLESMKLQWIL
ncbi:hypothetical protein [Okeania sp. SIO1I7]|nr:hypothetical protein [Okeania sp. SIO1I7]